MSPLEEALSYYSNYFLKPVDIIFKDRGSIHLGTWLVAVDTARSEIHNTKHCSKLMLICYP